MDIFVKTSEEMFALGENLAQKLHGGELLGLRGDLGAGKTLFSQGLARGLGVKERVNSPTFVIMKLYPASNNHNIHTFCHIDAYRLQSFADLEAVGISEYLADKNTVIAIEWPEKLGDFFDDKFLTIDFNYQQEGRLVKIPEKLSKKQ